MELNLLRSCTLVLVLSSLVGCGGGSGGGGDNPPADTAPPVVQVNPVSGSELQPDATVTLTFSEEMDRDSVVLSGSLQDEAAQYSWADSSTLTIAPESVWPEKTELALVINGADTAGNVMSETSVTYLVSDLTGPLVKSITPNGGRLDKDSAIVVYFSESMDKESLVLDGILVEDGIVTKWSKTSEENDTLTISPEVRWVSGEERNFTLSAKDAAGNLLGDIDKTYVVPLEFANFDSAEVVIGKVDFTSTESGVDGGTTDSLYGNVAVSDSGQLFIGDYGNDRVLGYSSLPETSGAWANFVLGQVDFNSSVAETSRSGMDGPQQVTADGNVLAVTEYGNHRVLIYNSVPEDGSALPDVVVGQQDFDSAAQSCAESGLNYPETAVLTDGKLIVTDSNNNRVLIWNSVPTVNGAVPDMVLGQSAFDSCEYNDDDQDGVTDKASARTLSYPSGIWSDGKRLAIVDNGNSRVLLWNSFPTDNFQPADIVLGQANFTDIEPLDAGAETLNYPYDGIWSNGIQLFVADSNNNRVLIWDSWPGENFAAADVVLGQGDFSHNAENDADQDGTEDATPAQNTLAYPTGVFGYRDLLFVSDGSNERVLMFRSR